MEIFPLETAEVVDRGGLIVTGHCFLREGTPRLGLRWEALRLRPCTQVELGELDLTPSTIKSVDSLRGFFLFFSPSLFVSNARVFFKEGHRFLICPLAGSRVVPWITSDTDIGVK